MQQNNRPVNLDLTQFRFPVAAISSIMHRITGFVLFVTFPIILYALGYGLASETNYLHIQEEWLKHGLIQFGVWMCLWTLGCHFCSGIRHLLLDFGLFESIQGGRYSAWAVIVASLIVAVLAGVWVW